MSVLTTASSMVVTGKRKRPTIDYATLGQPTDSELGIEDEGDVEDGTRIDAEDNCDFLEDDATYGSRKVPGKTKKQKLLIANRAKGSTPKKKQKPFPFLLLPAEIRDYIYELALVDPNGIGVYTKQKAARRVIRRSYSTFHDDEETSLRRSLLPQLLAVSKQIYAEAIGYLYKQHFVMQDTYALHTFVATISPFNRLQLTDITIRSWGDGRGIHKAMNFASLTLLGTCTNLKTLTFDCYMWCQRGDPKRLASEIFRNGHFFLEAHGAANRTKAAGVDVIKIGPRLSSSLSSALPIPQFEAAVRDQLRLLLKC